MESLQSTCYVGLLYSGYWNEAPKIDKAVKCTYDVIIYIKLKHLSQFHCNILGREKKLLGIWYS